MSPLEAICREGREIDDRRPIGDQIGGDPPADRTGRQSDMAVAEGVNDVRRSAGVPKDRQSVGCRRPVPHPAIDPAFVEGIRQRAIGPLCMILQDFGAGPTGRQGRMVSNARCRESGNLIFHKTPQNTS